MEEYSNISNVKVEDVKLIIPDLASLLYEMFCDKQRWEKERKM